MQQAPNWYQHWLGIDPLSAEQIAQARAMEPWDRTEADWRSLEIYQAAMARTMSGPGVVCDPEIMGGEPVIAGTRVPLELILGRLAGGATPEAVLHEYPSLPANAVETAIDYTQGLPAEHPLTLLLQEYRALCRG